MTRFPFTPELLDALPEPLAERFRGLEERLLREICSRLTAAGKLNEVTVQSIRALRAQGIPLEEIEQAIAETAGVASAELDELLNDVVRRNAAYYGELASLADVTLPDAPVDAADIDAIRRQTQETMTNLTATLGFTVRHRGKVAELLPPAEAFRWTLDQAELAVMSGAVSYDAAIRTAVKELADSGIRTVRYERDGKVRYDHADVAVRRAVMTGVTQISEQYARQSMEYLETDLVEVTAHKGARNTGEGPQNHAAWQGKVYRMGGPRGRYRGLEEVTGYGTAQGLMGPNCRHRFHPFVEGVSERTYTDEQLQEMDNPPFTYEGRTYDQYAASQRQREIERTVRKYKREEAAYQAAGLKEDASAVRAKRLRLEKEYAAFSKAADLPTQPERMRVLSDPGK